MKPPLDETGGPWWQIESITFGWLRSPMVLTQHLRETGEHATPEQLALKHINHCLSGAMDPGRPGSVAWLIPRLDVETPQQHGRCHHCA